MWRVKPVSHSVVLHRSHKADCFSFVQFETHKKKLLHLRSEICVSLHKSSIYSECLFCCCFIYIFFGVLFLFWQTRDSGEISLVLWKRSEKRQQINHRALKGYSKQLKMNSCFSPKFEREILMKLCNCYFEDELWHFRIQCKRDSTRSEIKQ